MKSKLLIFIFLIQTVSIYAQTTIRVTNGQNLQTLIDAYPAGTIFMVEGGIVNSNLDIDKKVSIIGTGYFLNATTQATPGVAQVSHIRLKPGSDGSFITGLQCLSINISANNILIQRCYATEPIRLGYTGLGSGGVWTGTANNCVILQNYSSRLEIVNQNAPNSSANNFVVKNNIFFRYGFHLEGNLSGEISNNTFMPGVATNEDYHSFQSSLNASYEFQWVCKILPIIFRNNIMPRVNVRNCSINSYPSTDFNGNVFTQNFTNLLSSNTINANPDDLFLGYPTNSNNALSPDARAQLATNSPAKGVGVGGTDAGAFGGDTPYVLNGIPNVPNIYSLTVPLQVPQNGTLNVQIKAKTNN